MRFEIAVEMDAEAGVEVTSWVAKVDGRDIAEWEADAGKSFIGQEMSYSLMRDLAGFGSIRGGQWTQGIAAFRAGCTWVQLESAPADGGLDASGKAPTRKGRGRGSRSG